eukprot:CAMPEP_0197037110 /NCGR_PEP_ID=MMETSP1384-20130603/14408_1 /TAXON_ID=29189 /ORGANISM="Ammonia sp." /LENGTH=485 /DNA_ID=CAMNT_0042467369 /DNA_START=77 /DNA_END=1534 /DNA_ORIENTATION=-
MSDRVEMQMVDDREDEDGIGKVYVPRRSSKCSNLTLWGLAISILVIVLLLGLFAGYFMGERSVLSALNTNNNNPTVVQFGGEDGGSSAAAANDISAQQRCANLRCCGYRDAEQTAPGDDGVNCKALKVEECVQNDEVCVWDCDEYAPQRRGRSNKRFVKFDEGIGELRQGNIRDDDDDDVLGNGNGRGPPTLESLVSEGTVYEYGSCGEVYKVSLSEEQAAAILQHIANDDGSRPHVDDDAQPTEDVEVEQDAVRRRMTVFGSDDRRELGTAPDMLPRQTVGIVKSASGDCTGTLISKRSVLTAASCVYDTVTNSYLKPITYFPDRYSWPTLEYDLRAIAVPEEFINLGDATSSISNSYNWALLTLDVADTGRGYFDFGYDDRFGPSMPSVSLNSLMYAADKSVNRRYCQYCEYNEWFPKQFRSTICDADDGLTQRGAPVYSGYDGVRTLLGVHCGSSASRNYYVRIDATKYWTIRNLIIEKELL